MTRSRTQGRLRSLFEAASELDSGERTAFLLRECAGESELLDRVSRLLAIDRAAGAVVESDPPAPRFREQAETAWEDAQQGDGPDRIGRYSLLELIGTGSSATVYRARQEHPDREVALKLLNPAPDESMLLMRFEREVQVLGQLEHPNIGRVYDAWAVFDESTVRPYFAMEMIDGGNIVEHCTRHQLPLRDRLKAFLGICDGIAHAHRNGVIHRDLKPDNILVNNLGVPKIVDFGIARLVDAGQDLATRWTSSGHIIGTIPYMSPEQLDSQIDTVDTLSDVYGLGVVLFEMVTGQRPFDTSGMSVLQAVRHVAEAPAPRARNVARVDRDLDAIIAKATARDRLERYHSPSALADDLQRYLDRRPVVAARSSAVRRLAKSVRRHPIAVSAGIIVTAAVLAGIMEVSDARTAAEMRRTELASQSVATEDLVMLVIGQIRAAAPGQRAAFVSSQTLLDSLAQSFEASVARGNYDGLPLVEARIRFILAETYNFLREPGAPIHHASMAVSLLDHELGGRHERTIRARLEYGRALMFGGKYADAEAVLAVAYRHAIPTLGWDTPSTFDIAAALANVYDKTGRSDRATPIYRSAMEARRRLNGDEDPMAYAIQMALAMALGRVGDYEQAMPLIEDAYETFVDSYGASGAPTLNAQYALVRILLWSGQLDRVEAHFPAIVDAASDRYGADHQFTNDVRNLQAMFLVKTDAPTEAIKIYDGTLASFEEAQPGVDRTLRCAIDRAECLLVLGRTDEATEALRRAAAAYLPNDEWGQQRLRALIGLTEGVLAKGDLAEASRVLADARNLVEQRDRTDQRLLARFTSVSDRLEEHVRRTGN